jgi:Uma2 family endonuclease
MLRRRCTPEIRMSTALSSFHVPNPPPGEDELPYDDGEPMDTERHRKQMNLLTESLELAWHDRDDFYVGGNMAIYFSELQLKSNDFRGPDIFVVLDTVRREHKSWVVWQEAGRTPDVVIELISPTTEHIDRGEKMRIYARLLRVPHYYLFDPLSAVLEGYLLDQERGDYVRMEPLPDGDLPCLRLHLRVGTRHGVHQGVEADWLRWIDEHGQVLATAEEQARAAEEQARAAEARAKEESRRRSDAERKLAEALAEIERLKGSRKVE